MGCDPDRYASIKETCAQFRFSKATFYRMLADRQNGLVDVVVRVPPVTGRIRVPLRRFEAWLRKGGRIRS